MFDAANPKGIAFATAAGILLFLQFALLSAALDFMTSILLFLLGMAAGRLSK